MPGEPPVADDVDACSGSGACVSLRLQSLAIPHTPRHANGTIKADTDLLPSPDLLPLRSYGAFTAQTWQRNHQTRTSTRKLNKRLVNSLVSVYVISGHCSLYQWMDKDKPLASKQSPASSAQALGSNPVTSPAHPAASSARERPRCQESHRIMCSPCQWMETAVSHSHSHLLFRYILYG